MNTAVAQPFRTIELSILPPESDPRTMTVAQAVVRYMQLRSSEGSFSARNDHQKRVARQLGRRFCEVVGMRPLPSIRPDDIRLWMQGLRHPKTGAPVEPATARHHLKEVKIFFKRCVIEEWLEKDPTIPVRVPVVVPRPVNIISPKDAFHVFKTNIDHRNIGRLALEAFGGLRFTTASKITKEDIKWERRGIEMPANKHKSGKRQYRQGHPANLWAWLYHAPEEGWEISWQTSRNCKMEMHFIAGLRKTMGGNLGGRYARRGSDNEERQRLDALKNVWRHSFASYLLALEKAYPRVSYLMQHTRPATTEIYEGLADETDAKLYFAITPDAVRTMEWEDFRKWVLAPRSTLLEPESIQRHSGPNFTTQPRQPEPMVQVAEDFRAG